MGVIQKPELQDYFSISYLNETPLFCRHDTLTRDRRSFWIDVKCISYPQLIWQHFLKEVEEFAAMVRGSS